MAAREKWCNSYQDVCLVDVLIPHPNIVENLCGTDILTHDNLNQLATYSQPSVPIQRGNPRRL